MSDGVAGIEARERVLENHRDVLADEIAPLALADATQIVTGKGQSPCANAAREIDHAKKRQRHHGLARAGLADDADDLALVDRQVNIVDGDELVRVGAERNGQAGDVEQRHSMRYSPGVNLTSSDVATTVLGGE